MLGIGRLELAMIVYDMAKEDWVLTAICHEET